MKKHLIFTGLFLGICVCVSAKVSLSKIFSDNMVLQRNTAISIWGWADPEETIQIQFHHQLKKIKAAKNGKWIMSLDAENAGGPYELVVTANNTIKVSNILIGEVWILSGQSNMEFTVNRGDHAKEEMALANYPLIRHAKVIARINSLPEEDAQIYGWNICNSSTVGDFSAVGYFFAKRLYDSLKVPIGLINATWGGTQIETWISRQGFESSSEFKDMIAAMPEVSLDSLYKLKISSKDLRIKALADTKLKDMQPEISMESVNENSFPSLCYNAMINPLISFSCKGVLWYQGESNISRAYQYRTSFPLLINDWRGKWNSPDLPFYFVQIAAFNTGGNSNYGCPIAELREAQTMALNLPNTGMVVTTDIGNFLDIHPTNKQDVGKRLAAIALNNLYRKNMVCSGPSYQGMQIIGSEVHISFNQIGSGLISSDPSGEPGGFEIAGNDQLFYSAKSKLIGNRVVLVSEQVVSPVAVRFGWSPDTDKCNLFNREGFPAVPFRTDQWKAITIHEKYRIEKLVLQ